MHLIVAASTRLPDKLGVKRHVSHSSFRSVLLATQAQLNLHGVSGMQDMQLSSIVGVAVCVTK